MNRFIPETFTRHVDNDVPRRGVLLWRLVVAMAFAWPASTKPGRRAGPRSRRRIFAGGRCDVLAAIPRQRSKPSHFYAVQN